MEILTLKQVTFLRITADQADQRIDNFLRTFLKGVPKSHIYRILRTGEVRVNKGRVQPTYRLQAEDELRLPPLECNSAPHPPHPATVQQLGDTILYEDSQILIIDKPAGLAVHGGSGIAFGIIEGLRVLYPQLKRLELVHRLDRETSGCLMIAKKASILKELHELLRTGRIKKEYLALVRGHWKGHLTIVESRLQKNNTAAPGQRMVRTSPTGKPSITHFEVFKRYPTSTLIKAFPITGRTHQIRVHTAQAACPIAGDKVYGDPNFNENCRHYGLNRLFLHAHRLTIEFPEHPLTVQAPLPDQLQKVLTALT